jgi:hypothetical protein
MISDGRPSGAAANVREAVRIAPHLRNYRRMLEAFESAAEAWGAEKRMRQLEQIEHLLDNEGNMNVPPLRRPTK